MNPRSSVRPIHKQPRNRSIALYVAAGLTALAAQTGAAEPAPDKSSYHLFNPVPAELMRELSTDRPDKTESAYTVDAGHFQIESDIVTFTHDHDKSNGTNTVVDAWTVSAVNVKAGLLNWMDVQLVLDTYNHVRTENRNVPEKISQSGLGDLTARLKMNIWGNDGGATAFAAMPFVKVPTAQDHLGNDKVDAGLILPLAVGLPAGWDMGMMTEFDFVHNDSGTGSHTEFINSITFSHDIVGELGGYVEFFSAVSTERDARWVGTFDLGLTYGLSKNLQLDAGVNLGLTKSADDVNPFVGISWRY